MRRMRVRPQCGISGQVVSRPSMDLNSPGTWPRWRRGPRVSTRRRVDVLQFIEHVIYDDQILQFLRSAVTVAP